ncbi:hypothetical protein TNCV_1163421 [Trichonephila clavipes]|nr:hypothetical protein TNCV_1163421 [Trichonephila clavipes]
MLHIRELEGIWWTCCLDSTLPGLQFLGFLLLGSETPVDDLMGGFVVTSAHIVNRTDLSECIRHTSVGRSVVLLSMRPQLHITPKTKNCLCISDDELSDAFFVL